MSIYDISLTVNLYSYISISPIGLRTSFQDMVLLGMSRAFHEFVRDLASVRMLIALLTQSFYFDSLDLVEELSLIYLSIVNIS